MSEAMNYKLPPLPDLLEKAIRNLASACRHSDDWKVRAAAAESLRGEIRAYAIAAIEAQGVPDGWQLVPKEPTPEMLDAGRNACNGNMYPQDMLHGPRSMMADRWFAALASAPPAPRAEQHPDDAAVDSFAAAMKDKLAIARQKGRGGWETCSAEDMGRMLREHVEKGDPRDVANFCMFLWSLGHGIAPQASVVQQEPIYQLQLASGAWIDQTEQSYRYNLKSFPELVRTVYTHPAPQAKTQPLSETANVRGRWNIELDGDDLLVCFNDHDKGESCSYQRYVPAQQAKPQPLSDEQIVPMFRRRVDMKTEGEKDPWFWYAWGVEDGETYHSIKGE